MSEKNRLVITTFIVAFAILYIICAFSQYTPDVSEWSTLSRAILGIGTLAILVWVIAVREYWDK